MNKSMSTARLTINLQALASNWGSRYDVVDSHLTDLRGRGRAIDTDDSDGGPTVAPSPGAG